MQLLRMAVFRVQSIGSWQCPSSGDHLYAGFGADFSAQAAAVAVILIYDQGSIDFSGPKIAHLCACSAVAAVIHVSVFNKETLVAFLIWVQKVSTAIVAAKTDAL